MNNRRLEIALFVIYFTTAGVFGLLMMRSVFGPFMIGLEGHSQTKLEGPRVCHSCRLPAWAAAQPGLPLPEQAESLAIPSHQRIRLDDGEGVAPIEPSGESAECETNGRVQENCEDFLNGLPTYFPPLEEGWLRGQ